MRRKGKEGGKRYVYLLDEAMQMGKIGLLSANLAEKIAMTAAESPCRVTAETISSTCGQSVSHGGAWNLVQRLGEKVNKEESYAVKQMEAGEALGKETLLVLFEEMDGVWLPMQGGRHQKMKKQEMKVFTMYEGWKAEDGGRSSLVDKTMPAGMEKSGGFHAKREALIEKRYAADGIVQRVLNGDGGGWVKEPYDPEAIVQLDRYHVYQEILRKIGDKKAQKEIRELSDSGKPDGMLDYIKTYADSVAGDEKTDNRRKKALELYRYLHSNREGLIPWQKRGIEIPAPPEGIVYKGMGVQESQNCTVITLRMKHRRMRWSVNGANNMAKILYQKANRELAETIGRYADGFLPISGMEDAVKILSTAKAPKKDGKGNPYVDRMGGHMPLLDAMRTASRKAFIAAFVD
nr:ISLre2 family transposase [uncultured Acetatifactor sp.]